MELYAYLAGPVEYEKDNGTEWRGRMENNLNSIDIKCFNPMKKPNWLPDIAKMDPKKYAQEINQEIFSISGVKNFCELEFEGLQIVRKYCLQLVNASDFAICRLSNVITVGTHEELVILKNSNKPVFFIIPDRKVPGWIYAMFGDPLYYFETEDETFFAIEEKVNNVDKMSFEEKLQWIKLTYKELNG